MKKQSFAYSHCALHCTGKMFRAILRVIVTSSTKIHNIKHLHNYEDRLQMFRVIKYICNLDNDRDSFIPRLASPV